MLATLNRLRAKVVGVVLNEVHKELSDSYYYYGYYRSYYRDRTAEPEQEVALMEGKPPAWLQECPTDLSGPLRIYRYPSAGPLGAACPPGSG